MKLSNTEQVKKWLRGLTLAKRELELKIEFYRELADDFGKVKGWEKKAERYKNCIQELEDEIDRLYKETDSVLSLLDNDERAVLTAKYITGVKWDYIEFQVYYSRRQAIRIHDRAIKKLVGATVGE